MNLIKKVIFGTMLLSAIPVFAGNEDRAGEAGASELLINPWGRSSGWGGANTAGATGIEAMNLNVAGLSYTKGSELVYANTQYLSGAGISINSVGFANRMGESGGVLGITAMAMDFGDIDRTNSESPDGGLGIFNPTYFNIGVGYSKNFSNTISGGVVVRVINQSIADVRATGVTIDAGVNHVTGDTDALKFGIALRNVGPTMNYSGNGLSARREQRPGLEDELTFNSRANDFEMPSLLNIGLSYDFFLMQDSTKAITEHRITAAGNFTSNSFTKDQIRVGLEYGFREMFMVRTGYVYENDVTDEAETATASAGLTAGATIEVPLGKSGSTFGIDYSFRTTRSFNGTSAIGIRLTF